MSYVFTGGKFPGGGTCGKTLDAGASCSVGVTFRALYSGSTDAQLKIAYDRNQVALRDITGKGIESVGVGIASQDGESEFAPAVVGGIATRKVFVVINDGAMKIHDITVLPLKGSEFTLSLGTPGRVCGAELSPAATCEIAIGFLPTEPGVYTGILAVSYRDGDETKTAFANFGGRGLLADNVRGDERKPLDSALLSVGAVSERSFFLLNDGNGNASGLRPRAPRGAETVKQWLGLSAREGN